MTTHRTRTAAGLVALAVGAAGLAAVTTAAPAEATSTWTSTVGTGTGAIPDGPSPCVAYGAPRVVSFTVAGMPVAPLSGVRIAGATIAHSFIGDLDVVLTAPNAAHATIFSRVGDVSELPGGDNSNLGGSYSFGDAPTPNNLWVEAAAGGPDQVIAPGRYNATAAGTGSGTTGGATTSITDAFSSVTDPNGTWTLSFQDHCHGDAGSVTAVTLQLQSSAGLGPCASFGIALLSAQNDVDTAVTALTTARTQETTAATAVGVAQGATDAATQAAAAATTAVTASDAALTAATAKVATATKALAKAKKSHSKPKIAKATKALKAAKSVQANRKKTAAAAHATLTADTQALTTATQTLATKQADLDTAGLGVSAADATLAAAQDALSSAREEYGFCVDA